MLLKKLTWYQHFQQHTLPHHQQYMIPGVLPNNNISIRRASGVQVTRQYIRLLEAELIPASMNAHPNVEIVARWSSYGFGPFCLGRRSCRMLCITPSYFLGCSGHPILAISGTPLCCANFWNRLICFRSIFLLWYIPSRFCMVIVRLDDAPVVYNGDKNIF